MTEFMLNALRLPQGFERDQFVRRTGLPWSCLEDALERGRKQGFLVREGAWVRPTEHGLRYLDDTLQLFG